MTGQGSESIADKVARTRREQGLPAVCPASSLRALADLVKQSFKDEQEKAA